MAPKCRSTSRRALDDPANAEAKEQIAGMFSRPGTDTGARLKLYIERVERLDEEIKGLNEDKSDLFKEMKGRRLRHEDHQAHHQAAEDGPHERQEAEALLQTYMDAIGMTPIEAAIALAALRMAGKVAPSASALELPIAARQSVDHGCWSASTEGPPARDFHRRSRAHVHADENPALRGSDPA
jgi:uncharacterized protein (UPF0335 family)